ATSSTYADLPYKFEAGTHNIEAVIAWGTAIDWMNQVGIANIEAHETELLAYGHQLLAEIPGLILYGSPRHKAAVLSFNIDGLHPYDVGTLLDQMGIAVRTGQHCAQPIMTCLQVPGTIRASLAVYTRRSDLEALASGLKRAINALT
ncbi:MAG: aminotransferase class V-fold PLP-dependent enzyme, partial [Schleiferiaceae bacterium]|nr:aminotransferase class V-fold PLP-dependent enzyme [Schleiferiaceae bacterium]